VAAPAPPDWHFCSLTDKARKSPETCRAQGLQYCFFDGRSGSGAVRREKPVPGEIAGVFPCRRHSMREKLESLVFVRASVRLSAHLLTAGCRLGTSPWAQARAWSDARSMLTDMAICTSTLERRDFGGWCRRVQPGSSGVFKGAWAPTAKTTSGDCLYRRRKSMGADTCDCLRGPRPADCVFEAVGDYCSVRCGDG
jgi:hypothetical protein